MATNRTFSDIDFSFTPHPDSGDVLRVYDTNSIIQSVKSLVLTEYYGRPFHPEIGSSVAGLLFELRSPIVDLAIQTSIMDIIDNEEPRASVQDVYVEWRPKNNGYYVEVSLFLKALMQEITVDFILERVR